MATLTPTLTLASTDAASDELNMTVTDTLTVGAPSAGVSRLTISTGAATVLLAAASHPAHTYVYLNNTHAANTIEFLNDDGEDYMTLSPGEFAFLPVKGGVGLECVASSPSTVLEYAYWTKA
jgi:hypothetical protein